MSRQEFSKKTKLQAFERSGGKCEKCTAKLGPGNTEFHHETECTMGGDNGLRNCVVLCRGCHRAITSGRQRVIAKSNRQRDKHLGIKSPKGRSFPYGKTSRYKKKLDGRVVER